MLIRLALAGSLALASVSHASAFDNGQWEGIDPKIRDWFKAQRAPNGVPCCDTSDGHPTDYDIRERGYYVPVPWNAPGKENWALVPPEVVIRKHGNPVGTAIVWYVESSKFIRCFVPASEM